MNERFSSQFTQEDLRHLPELNPNKATGPDGIPSRYLKITAKEIGLALKIVFQLSYDTGVVPDDWLISNISPIFKKGDRTNPANYRSVNLTSVCSKIFEHILKSNIMNHLDRYNILCANQHGFRRNHSCVTQLINNIQDVATHLDQKHQDKVITWLE